MHKDRMHDHYWIKDGKLYESYHTIRGLRYRFLCDVELPNTNKCSDYIIKYIRAEYF